MVAKNADTLGRQMDLKTYDALRKYIENENTILNYRMTWLLTINGFLYASYALVIQKVLDANFKYLSGIYSRVYRKAFMAPDDLLCSVLIIICFAGVMICQNVRSGIKGARRAVNYLESFVEHQFDNVVILTSDPEPPANIFQTAKRLANRFKSNTFEIKNRTIVCVLVKEVGLMPFITGGGFHAKARTGSITSKSIPRVLQLGWLLLLFVALFLFHAN